MSTTDVDTILTDTELDEYLGGQALGLADAGAVFAGQALKPRTWTNLKPAKQYALDRLLEALRRRSPPILEAEMADMSETKPVLLDGAAAHLYRLALTSANENDPYWAKYKDHSALYKAALDGFKPTLIDRAQAVVNAIPLERR